MPMYNDAQLFSVPVTAGASSYTYIFRTKVRTSVSTDLQHAQLIIPATGYKLGVGEIVGAQIPKPAVYSKKGATGGTSFINPAAVTTALASGYVRRSRVKVGLQKSNNLPTGTGKGQSLAVATNVNGVYFAWRMPGEQYIKISGEIASLGIEILDTEAKWAKAVFGATYPRPPRVRKVLDNGVDGEDVITTFCNATTIDSLPAGWSAIKEAQLMLT